jgi:cell division septation protein DedD
MARWGSEAGIGYGQAFLLVFGFLITSVIIFLFGMWIGRDLAERHVGEQEPMVRAPIPLRPSPDAEAGVGPEFYETVRKQAYERLQSPEMAPTPTPPPNTPTRPIPSATKTQPPPPPTIRPTPPSSSPPPVASGQWSVQVGATVDPHEALELTLRLRARGFEAYTVQAPLSGQTWYRVRVGRFQTREEARETEARLRRTGEFKGAYVTSQ